MLVGLREILALAEEKNACIPAFNVYNLETVKGVMRAAEKARSPVILQLYSRLVTSGAAEGLSELICGFANRAKVPVCFHLDHGAGEREVVRSLRYGMTGIMIDASTLPLEENISVTKGIVRLCGHVGVAVEGELGHIGKAADGDERVTHEYTRPEEAEQFVAETGVAALAVMVGTAHGKYKKLPVLDIDRIAKIKEATGIPLVLHGGSGVPDDQIRRAVAAGIRKMNFSTDLCCAFLDACRVQDKSIVGIDLFMEKPIAAAEAFVLEKIGVLGSGGIV